MRMFHVERLAHYKSVGARFRVFEETPTGLSAEKLKRRSKDDCQRRASRERYALALLRGAR